MRVRSLLVRLTVLLALAGGGVTMLVAGPAAPALGSVSAGPVLKVAIESPATLVARGAGLAGPVKVFCSSGQAFLSLQVTERAGSSVVSGYGFTQIACNGLSQTMVLTITDSSAKAFRKGIALAQADLFGCIGRKCSQQSASRVIQVVKPRH